MTSKHIAASGKYAQQWVTCPAKQKCTLSSAEFHTTAAELTQVQQYVKQKTGHRIGAYELTLASVLEYKILSKTSKQEILKAVE